MRFHLHIHPIVISLLIIHHLSTTAIEVFFLSEGIGRQAGAAVSRAFQYPMATGITDVPFLLLRSLNAVKSGAASRASLRIHRSSGGTPGLCLAGLPC